MYTPWINRSLQSNGVLREAESPDSGHCQRRKERPEIPAAPCEAWNSQRHQQDSHRAHDAGVFHPMVRQTRHGHMPQAADEQKTRQYGNVDRSPHAGMASGTFLADGAPSV